MKTKTENHLIATGWTDIIVYRRDGKLHEYFERGRLIDGKLVMTDRRGVPPGPRNFQGRMTIHPPAIDPIQIIVDHYSNLLQQFEGKS